MTKLPKKKTKAVRDLHGSGHSDQAIADLLGLDVAVVRAALYAPPPKVPPPKPPEALPREQIIRVGDGTATLYGSTCAVIHAGPRRDVAGGGGSSSGPTTAQGRLRQRSADCRAQQAYLEPIRPRRVGL